MDVMRVGAAWGDAFVQFPYCIIIVCTRTRLTAATNNKVRTSNKHSKYESLIDLHYLLTLLVCKNGRRLM